MGQSDVLQEVDLEEPVEALARRAGDGGDEKDAEQDRLGSDHSEGLAALREHACQVSAFVARRGNELLLPHQEVEGDAQQEREQAAQDDRQVEPDRRQRNAGDHSREPGDLADLRPAQEEAGSTRGPHLFGDPGVLGAVGETRARAPDHLGHEDRPEVGDQALDHEAGADQDGAGDHRQLPAVGVGQQPGGNLEDQAGELEHRAHKEQAERVEVRHHDLVDDVDGDDGGEEERRRAAHQ